MSYKNMSRILSLIVMLLFAFTPISVFAAVPQTITYQGYLTAADGTPINKNVTLQLSLYDVATLGTAYWTEQQGVTVTGGQFSVNLGMVTPLNLAFDKTYYLGIKVDAEPELAPRQIFTSSPYAIRSGIADSVTDGSIASKSLQDASVTATKLGIACATGQILMRSATGWGCGNAASSSNGTITGFISGNGITVSGVATTPQIDVNFGGNGTANTAARSDHSHDSLYQKKNPLRVVATIPTSGSGDSSFDVFPVNGVIRAKFNSAIDPTTLTASTFKLVNNFGTAVPGTISYDSITRAVSFTPSALLTDKTLTAIVTTGVKSFDGSTLEADYRWNFDVSPVDTSLFKVNSFQPNGSMIPSSGIPLSVNSEGNTVPTRFQGLSVSFNRKYDYINVPASAFVVKDDKGANVVGTVITDNNYYLYYKLAGPLKAGTIYTATITGIKDYAGNSLAAPYTYTFKTSVIDAPSGLQAVAGNGQATVTWNPVPGATSYNLYWMSGSWPLSYVKTEGSKIANVTSPYIHTGLLAGSYQYVITAVKDTSEGIESSSASVYLSSDSKNDNIPVSVISNAPVNLTTGVSTDTRICIQFNKPVSMATDNIVVKNSSNSVVTGIVNSNCFVPDAVLLPNTTYTVTVNNVKDAFNNSMVVPYNFSFTTSSVATPNGLLATAGTGGPTLNWNNVPGATSYNLYWSTSSAVSKTSGIKLANVISPYFHSGLAPAKIYYVVTAVNGTNESGESNVVSTIVDNNIAPSVTNTYPQNNSSNNSSSISSFQISFNKPANIKNVSITVREADGTIAGIFDRLAGTGYSPGSGSYYSFSGTVNMLKPAVIYTATISGATNLSGTATMAPYSWSFTTAASPSAPVIQPPVGAPTSVSAYSCADGINISWIMPQGAITSNIYWSTTPGVTTSNGSKLAGAAPSFGHFGLTKGATYYYVVTGLNAAGESIASAQVSAVAGASTSVCYSSLSYISY